MTERVPKFTPGQAVKVADPKRFISSFEKKVTNRKAIVEDNILDYALRRDSGNEKSFRGRVRVRFEKRNGRGKEFTEIMQESFLTEWQE